MGSVQSDPICPYVPHCLELIMKKAFILFFFVLFVSGCVSGRWVTTKNGQSVTEAEFLKDNLACEEKAAMLYPYVAATTSEGGGSPAITNMNCSRFGTSINCSSTSGAYTAPTVTTTDGNAANRENYKANCIAALGYDSIFIDDSLNMECINNSQCGYGKSCRSVKTGGTRCVNSDDAPQSTSTESANLMGCRTSSDCPSGKSCRSKQNGGAECR